MAHWLSYGLSDFLMFSPATYRRMFELHNAAVWPAQIAAAAAAILMVWLLWKRPGWQGRGILLILAAAWAFVGWAFHLERYAAINTAAPWFAVMFFAQAGLLAWAAFRPPVFAVADNAAGRAAAMLLAVALLLQPLAGPLGGRPWTGAEIFAVAPDPTATATMAMLLFGAGRTRWALLVLPLLWCAASGLTLAAMSAPQAMLMPAVGLIVVMVGLLRLRLPVGPPAGWRVRLTCRIPARESAEEEGNMSRLEQIFGALRKQPGDEYIRKAFERYRALMGAGDLDGIVALFAPDARWEEPVGTAPAVGHDAIRARYKAALEGSGGRIPMRADGATRIAGHRALACSIAEVAPDGKPMIVETANVLTFDEAGLITEMLIYVGMGSFKPKE